MTIKPINEDHAVTSVVITLQLDEFVEARTLQAMRKEPPSWREELPAITPTTVQIQADGQGFDIPGVQFAIVRPDARAIWALGLQGYELSVECTAYTRWAGVWAQARGYLLATLASIRQTQPEAKVSEVRLKVADQFRSVGLEYSAEDLFDLTGALDDVAKRGPIWNLNTGWFHFEGSTRVQSALAIRVAGQSGPDNYPTGPFNFYLMHEQRARLRNPGPLSDDQVEPLVLEMHFKNKAELARLLSTSMKSQIGLMA